MKWKLTKNLRIKCRWCSIILLICLHNTSWQQNNTEQEEKKKDPTQAKRSRKHCNFHCDNSLVMLLFPSSCGILWVVPFHPVLFFWNTHQCLLHFSRSNVFPSWTFQHYPSMLAFIDMQTTFLSEASRCNMLGVLKPIFVVIYLETK